MIRAYTCNLRVFWAVLLFLGVAAVAVVVVVFHHRAASWEQQSEGSVAPPGADSCCDGAGHSVGFLLLELLLAGVLGLLCLR